jgi:hypothetical protein
MTQMASHVDLITIIILLSCLGYVLHIYYIILLYNIEYRSHWDLIAACLAPSFLLLIFLT